MTITLQPFFSQLNHDVKQVSQHESDFKNLFHQKELIERLAQEINNEVTQNESFNWELHPTNRKLLDDIYDLDLLQGIEERTYAFTERDQIMAFTQRIRSALEGKSSEVQDQHQLCSKQKEELMQFYQTLLDLISKLAQILAAITQKI